MSVMNPFDDLRWPAMFFICALMFCGGCAGTTHVKTGRHDQFRNSLVETCRLIQISEFDQARSHLLDARSLAMDNHQISKVGDLEGIIRGAEAMQSGNPSLAADCWLEIRDENLKRQLVDLGMRRGIDLRAIADAGTSGRKLTP